MSVTEQQQQQQSPNPISPPPLEIQPENPNNSMFNLLKKKKKKRHKHSGSSPSLSPDLQSTDGPLEDEQAAKTRPQSMPIVASLLKRSSQQLIQRDPKEQMNARDDPNRIETRLLGQPLPPTVDQLPRFILDAMRHIENYGLYTEGIFRLAASRSQVESVIRKIENEREPDYRMYDIHVPADLLKRYFRELPDPILAYEHYDMFLAAETTPEYVERAQMIKRILEKFLPRNRYDVIKLLCLFLGRVLEHSHINKMTATTLAVCFAPNLLKPRQQSSDQLEILKDTKISNDLMKTLIEEASFFFENGVTLKFAPEWAQQQQQQQWKEQQDQPPSVVQATHISPRYEHTSVNDSDKRGTGYTDAQRRQMNRADECFKDEMGDLINISHEIIAKRHVLKRRERGIGQGGSKDGEAATNVENNAAKVRDIEIGMNNLNISSTTPPVVPRRIVRQRRMRLDKRKSRYDLVEAFQRDFRTRKRPVFHVTSANHHSGIGSGYQKNDDNPKGIPLNASTSDGHDNKKTSKKFKMFSRK